jgi:hypothetical protein
MNGFEPEYVAKTLVDHCLGMGSTDNISIIIISFLNKAKIQKFSNSDLKGMTILTSNKNLLIFLF